MFYETFLVSDETFLRFYKTCLELYRKKFFHTKHFFAPIILGAEVETFEKTYKKKLGFYKTFLVVYETFLAFYKKLLLSCETLLVYEVFLVFCEIVLLFYETFLVVYETFLAF